jgi:hypothetical protein
LIAPFFLRNSQVSVFTTSTALEMHRWLLFVQRFVKLEVLPQFFEPGFLLLARPFEKRDPPPPRNDRIATLVYTLMKPRVIWRFEDRGGKLLVSPIVD